MLSKIINLLKIKKELKALEKELKTVPEGRLNRKGKYYYHLVGRKEVAITKDLSLIKRLCRKAYVTARITQLQNNLSKPIEEFDHRTPRELITSLSKTYQDAPISYFYHPSVEKWLAKEKKQNPYPMQNGFRTSLHKILLRSKSEHIIASLLEEYGLLYKYDTELVIGGKSKYPDFQIINPFTGKTVIWEHFGALNQPSYKASMDEKMKLYAQAGYISNETIIFTFEIDIISENRLRDLIEQVIL